MCICLYRCVYVYICVCMYVCRNGGCIPWFLVHQGGSISSGRESKPKTVLQQSWEEVWGSPSVLRICAVRVWGNQELWLLSQCLKDAFQKAWAGVFFQIIQEKTESFRVPGKKDFMGIWDSREVSGPSGSCPCLPVVQLHQVTTVLVSMGKRLAQWTSHSMGYIGTKEDVFSMLQRGISHTLFEVDANIISGDHEDQGTEMLHVVSEIT